MKHIYMWGTGRLSAQILEFKVPLDTIEAFIDNDEKKKEYMGKKVIPPKDLSKTDYDVILVANDFSEEIFNQCKQLEINLKKVIFLFKNCTLYDFNQNYELAAEILGQSLADEIRSAHYVIRGPGGDAYEDCIGEKEIIFKNDYVRMKTFQLAAEEIKNRGVSGDVAELGVFRGEFAQYINAAFPDRRCYLFDTFEGYGENEVKKEIERGNSNAAMVEIYKETDVDLVMKKMSHPDQVIIKKGLFPESLNGLDSTFAFVSIDVNYEDSIYNGLEYFYERLNIGGYIFIHDYRTYYRGVKEAVCRYEKIHNVSLCKVPLCDKNGSLVITR